MLIIGILIASKFEILNSKLEYMHIPNLTEVISLLSIELFGKLISIHL